MTADEPVRVGVLSLHNSKETKAILNAVEDLGHEPVWLRTENTAITITDSEVTLEPDVDVIANRLLLSNTEEPAEGLGLAATFDRIRPMLNRPEAVLTSIHKFATGTTLAHWNVRVPDALLALSNGRLNEGREQFGEVGVYKTAIGTHGGGTWKVDLTEPVNPKVGNRQAFLQELIDRDDATHRDLRVYVVGEQIIGAMYRYAPEGDWRTNVALGGAVESATDMPEEAAETALYAADVLGLDYAGVDLVEGHDGWFVLEVNPTAVQGSLQGNGDESRTRHRPTGHRAGWRDGRSRTRRGIVEHPRRLDAVVDAAARADGERGDSDDRLHRGGRRQRHQRLQTDPRQVGYGRDPEQHRYQPRRRDRSRADQKHDSGALGEQQDRQSPTGGRSRDRDRWQPTHRHRERRGPQPHGLSAVARPGHSPALSGGRASTGRQRPSGGP